MQTKLKDLPLPFNRVNLKMAHLKNKKTIRQSIHIYSYILPKNFR